MKTVARFDLLVSEGSYFSFDKFDSLFWSGLLLKNDLILRFASIAVYFLNYSVVA